MDILDQLKALQTNKAQGVAPGLDVFRAAADEIERLRGLKPELPPFAPEGSELPRYGLRWNSETEPLSVPMDDGYWTPWHLAEKIRIDGASTKDDLNAAYRQLNQKYAPPPGVIGYARKDDLEQAIAGGSQYFDIGLDSADCWEQEAPYPFLVALCAVDSIREHDTGVLQRLNDYLCSINCSDYQHVIDEYIHKFNQHH